VLFEAAGVSGKIDVRSAALLHRWTDRYLELPVLAAVADRVALRHGTQGWDAGVRVEGGSGGLGLIMFNPPFVYVLVERRWPDRGLPSKATLHLADDLHGCARFLLAFARFTWAVPRWLV